MVILRRLAYALMPVSIYIVIATKHPQILRVITTTIPFRMNMIDLEIKSTSTNSAGSGISKLTAAMLLKDDLLSLWCQRMPVYFRSGSGVSECQVLVRDIAG
jgi:hypothetical protein